MRLLKGKPVADMIKEKTADITAGLLEQNIAPTLGILRVGENGSDIAYENSAVKAAGAVGVHVENTSCPPTARRMPSSTCLKS